MNYHFPCDILLVIPIREGFSGITIDLGLLYLYSALKEHGLNAAILHCPKERINESSWVEILKANAHIKIIGFKMYSMDHNSVKRMSQQAKRLLPDCVTIAGGPHTTSLPDYVLFDIPTLDFLLGGEGELPFPQFCKSILSGKSPHDTPGLTYRWQGRIISNKRKFIENLDLLPRIRWEDVNIEKYPDFLSSLPFIPIMATRGCPFECKYCASHVILGRKMRFRSVQNVINELSFLKNEKGVASVTFTDDELTLNRKYFVELCNGIIDSKIDIKWECDNGVRLDTLDQELVDLMYEAGCRFVAVGIESASDHILQKMKKRINTQTIREKVFMVKQSRIVPQGLFMMGFPEETEEDVLKTIKFSLELDLDKTNFSIFMPLPGSEIFSELIEKGELSLDQIDWDKMKPDKIVWQNGTVSAKKLKLLQKYAYLRFYLRPKPIVRLFREIMFKKNGFRVLWSKVRSILWQ